MSEKKTSKIPLVDLLGIKVGFNYKGSSQSKSISGAGLTLLIMIVAILAYIYSGRDLVQRKNPRTNRTTVSLENPGRLSISPETMTLSLTVFDQNKGEEFKDESIYQIRA